MLEESLRFKGSEMENTLSVKTPADMEDHVVDGSMNSSKNQETGDELPSSERFSDKNTEILENKSPVFEPRCRRYQAALRLQKVYKSFRTRRQLADCAVLVEQSWWKLLDFAELKRSSISFFEIEKPETAISRWSRARTRAAKVGKGLSKDEKARKLALQHWLEAIDPRHRYGHNLQFYYVKWLHCQSKQPFFFWLDIGEGRETNLERCSRSKLQQQCIRYLGPTEREAYEVEVDNGRFRYKQSNEILHTTSGPNDAKWIFVLSTSKTLYVGLKNKGTFQHSSFLAGGATLSAGRLVVNHGVLKAVWPHSGHYLPTEENFQEFMSFLRMHNVDLSNVKKSPCEEDEEHLKKKIDKSNPQNNSIEADSSKDTETTNPKISTQETSAEIPTILPLQSKLAKLNIPARNNMFDIEKNNLGPVIFYSPARDSASEEDGFETAEESFIPDEAFLVPKVNLFDEDHEAEVKNQILEEKILKRIDSHKSTKSFQLAQQLSCRWTTGAGPRIGCMRDYPIELQCRVLEQANLSPRKSNFIHRSTKSLSRFNLNGLTPNAVCREDGKGSTSSVASDQVILSQSATPGTLDQIP